MKAYDITIQNGNCKTLLGLVTKARMLEIIATHNFTKNETLTIIVKNIEESKDE